MKLSFRSRNPLFLSALCSGLLATLAGAPQARAQAAATLTTLHGFTREEQSEQPKAGVLLASDGNFYGTTTGTYDKPTFFKMTPDGTVTNLYVFGDNLNPDSELIQTSDGSIYGVAALGEAGSAPHHGGIFRLSPDGTVSVIHYFNADSTFTEGTDPTNCGLTQASDGNLYGLTSFGASSPTARSSASNRPQITLTRTGQAPP